MRMIELAHCSGPDEQAGPVRPAEEASCIDVAAFFARIQHMLALSLKREILCLPLGV
jgi:hypothetical protein